MQQKLNNNVDATPTNNKRTNVPHYSYASLAADRANAQKCTCPNE